MVPGFEELDHGLPRGGQPALGTFLTGGPHQPLLGKLYGVNTLGAFIGAPLFGVMGGAASLAWLSGGAPLRHLAPKVLDDKAHDLAVKVTKPHLSVRARKSYLARRPTAGS